VTSPSPQGWKVERLLDLVSIRSGQIDPKLAQYRRMPLIAPDHIESGTGRLLEVRSAREQGAISGKYLVDQGDIVYSKIRPYLMKAHRAEFPALCSADMYPLKPRKGADGRFVLNLLLGRDFANFAVGESMRSGIPKINRVGLAGYELLVPPDDEQKLIGAALGDADGLIQTLEKTITKKRAIKQGMMQELLTGRTRLPGFSGVWGDLASLTDLCTRSTGFWGADRPSAVSPHRVHVITAGDITPRGRISGTSERYFTNGQLAKARCRKDDVVITSSGNGLGKTAYVDNPGILVASNFVRILRPRRGVSGAFLAQVMWAPGARAMLDSNTATSAYPNLMRSFFSEKWLPNPRLDEQLAVATVLHDYDLEIEGLERRLEATRAIKQGMMQELLAGRTRLVHSGSDT